jgi:hypothetical protein
MGMVGRDLLLMTRASGSKDFPLAAPPQIGNDLITEREKDR